jgi:hypothetical protein
MRAFMVISILLGEKYLFIYDLESFFWVLFWICIYYNRLDQRKVVLRFEKWNYANIEELAVLKSSTISDKSIFLRIMEEIFTSYYLLLIPCVNRL